MFSKIRQATQVHEKMMTTEPFLLLLLLLQNLAEAEVSKNQKSPGLSTSTCDASGHCTSPTLPTTSTKYCIIGAGPAGVQMGHFMNRAGRDYVVFERGHRAGRFFNKYPVHRRLNSYNRRYTRTAHGEFRLRHDWHTLLEHDDVPRFPNWTKDFWPEADVYVNYLDEFQKEQEEAGHMRYCHHVTAIRRRDGNYVGDLQYELTIRLMEPCTSGTGWDGINNFAMGETEVVHHCQVLVMADGMWKPTSPDSDWMQGADLALGYDELRSFNNSDFEGKSVLILGYGNAAFETADAVRNYASDIVIFSRNKLHMLVTARYVGGVRSPRMQIFDAGELKSLEAVVDTPHEPTHLAGTQLPSTKWALVPCGHANAFSGWPDPEINRDRTGGFGGKGPLCIFEMDSVSGQVVLGWADKNYWQVRRAKELFGEKLSIRDAPDWIKVFYDVAVSSGQSWIDLSQPNAQHLSSRVANETNKWKVMMMNYNDLREPLTEQQRDLLAELTALTKGLQKRAYELDKSFDVVIRCWGWRYDSSPFQAGGITVRTLDLEGRPGMYPQISSSHESISAKDIFFIGANAHGLDRDRYKASGGFVHGYRYTTRTVFRTLEERYEKMPRQGQLRFPWPKETNTGAIDFEELLTVPMWKHLLSRVLFSAASYEMVGGALVDGIVFNATDESCVYIEEVAEDFFHARNSQHMRLTFGFYGGEVNPQTPFKILRIPEFAPQSHPFHAVLEFFPKGVVYDRNDMRQRWLPVPAHPSALWPKNRRSARFHFKADRLTDFSTSAQVPVLDNFLRDMEHAVIHDKPMPRKYHEWYD